jgi:methyl-accepting chemotaxis protein
VGELENRKSKRGMTIKVCIRSSLGAAALGVIIGTILTIYPDLNKILTASVLALIGGAFIGLYSSKKNIVEFVDPALQIADFAEQVASGDLTGQVTGIDSGHMALVAGTMNNMAARLRDLINQTNNVNALVANSSQILEELSQETGIAAREVARSMQAISSGADEQRRQPTTPPLKLSTW